MCLMQMPKEPTSVCPFCFPFYPLSQRILLPSRLKHCFWDYPRPVLPSTRTCSAATGIAPGLTSLPLVPAADCPLPHAVTACCVPKPELPTDGSPLQQSKSEQTVPPGADGKTRQSKRHPLSGGCLVLFLGNFFSPAELFQVQAVFQNVAHSIEQSDAEQQ